MENIEIQNRKVEIITDMICDYCGGSCKVYENTVDNDARVDHGEKFYSFEFLKLSTDWGYHSNKDGQTWSAILCEKCVDEKLSFIKFKKTNYF